MVDGCSLTLMETVCIFLEFYPVVLPCGIGLKIVHICGGLSFVEVVVDLGILPRGRKFVVPYLNLSAGTEHFVSYCAKSWYGKIRLLMGNI